MLLACSHPTGTHSRLLIASDGLWDVVSHAQACKLVRNAPTAQRAADSLLGTAQRISNERRGRTRSKRSRRDVEPQRIQDTSRARPIHTYIPAQMAAQPAAALRNVPVWARLCSHVGIYVRLGVRGRVASAEARERNMFGAARHRPREPESPDRRPHRPPWPR